MKLIEKTDPQPDGPLTPPAGAPLAPEAQLVAAESATIVGPDDLDQPPVIVPNPAAVDAYTAQAVTDAAHPGFDIHSPNPAQPSAALVAQTAQTPLIRLGERFQAFYVLYTNGRLGQVTPAAVTTWQILKGLWHYLLIGALVLGSAITVEVIYGSAAADLLARNTHDVSVRAAIAATLVLNGGAWFFADLAHMTNPHLARRRGLWIALAGFIGIGIVVTCLGLVIGGWDPLQVTTVTGGGANTTAATDVDHRWLLAGTYISLVVLATLVTAAGHYLILDTYQERYTHQTKTNEKRARDASLTPAQQHGLAARLAQAYLDTIPTAEQHVRIRLEAYNTSFARHVSPELNDAVNPIGHTAVTPLWAAQAHQLTTGDATSGHARRISAEHHRGTSQPPVTSSGERRPMDVAGN